MKIAQVIYGFAGGGAPKVAISLTEELIKLNYKVDIIRVNISYNNSIEENTITNLKRLNVSNFILNRKPGSFGFKSIIQLIKLINKEKYDIVHSHLFVPDLYTALAKYFIKDRFVHIITVHNTVSYHSRLLIKTLFNNSYFVRCSPAINKINSKKIEYVVSNAVNINSYSPKKKYKTKNIKEELGLPASCKLVVSVGNLRIQKNQIAGIHMMKHLIDDFKIVNVHYLICGHGTEEESLRKISKELNLSKNIHFLGLREDIPHILNTSDVFFNFSKWEGLPLAVIEAFTSGITTILSPIKEHKVIAVGLYENFITEGFDGESFALALKTKLEANDSISHFDVYKLRQNQIKQYSLKYFSREYIKIYENHAH